MFCANCGANIPDDSVFCPECGVRLEQYEAPTPTPAPAPAPAVRPETGMKKKKSLLPVVLVVLAAAAILAFLRRDALLSLLRGGDQPEAEQAGANTETAAQEWTEEVQDAPDFDENEAPPVTEPETDPAPQEDASSENAGETAEDVPQENSADTGNDTPQANPGETELRYDPVDYEAFVTPTLEDFIWGNPTILAGNLPEGSDRITNFEEVKGGWKMYIIDDPADGEAGDERLCRCAFGEDSSGKGIGIRWDYVHTGEYGEGYMEERDDTFYYGTWENGCLDAVDEGSGSILLTNFWYLDGHEYAVGRMRGPEGRPAAVLLVRP